jgi:hypothetical protein
MLHPQSTDSSSNSSIEHPIESELGSHSRSSLTLVSAELTQTQQEIVAAYHQNSSEFAIADRRVRIASVTKESIYSNWGIESKNVVLAQTHNSGNYWIFNAGDCTYLVPAKSKYINRHAYTIASWMFEGHNYTPDYLNIQLVKPAIVIPLTIDTHPPTWQLQHQGELIFS